MISGALALAAPGWASAKSSESVPPDLRAALRASAGSLESNDAREIGRWLSPQWSLIDSDGHLLSRARFLEVIASGDLSHGAMRYDEQRVVVSGNVATVTARALGSGIYLGQSYPIDERSTDVWVKHGGRWAILFTQLTRMAHGGN